MSARRRLLTLGLVIAAMFGVVALTVGHSPHELRRLVAEQGALAPAAFLGVWLVATPALFPGTVLGAAGGLLFGTGLGLGLSVAGATLGAMISFASARRFGHEAAQSLAPRRLDRAQQQIERHGFKAVVLLRAAPGMPAGLLYYAAGLSRVRARDFAAGVLVGGAPRVFAYTALGGSGGHLGSPTAIAALALIAVPPVVVAALVLARRLRPA